jgi:hypothetical protein
MQQQHTEIPWPSTKQERNEVYHQHGNIKEQKYSTGGWRGPLSEI